MPSPTMMRGLLGIFLRGAAPPRLLYVNTPHPRLSSLQDICPYRKYWWPGPREEESRVARVDARAFGRAQLRVGEQGGLPGTVREQLAL